MPCKTLTPLPGERDGGLLEDPLGGGHLRKVLRPPLPLAALVLIVFLLRVRSAVMFGVEEVEEDADAAVAGHLLATVGRRRHVRQHGRHLRVEIRI